MEQLLMVLKALFFSVLILWAISMFARNQTVQKDTWQIVMEGIIFVLEIPIILVEYFLRDTYYVADLIIFIAIAIIIIGHSVVLIRKLNKMSSYKKKHNK